MIPLPSRSDPYRIVGIDNGTINMGLCVMDLDLATYKPCLIDAHTVNAQALSEDHGVIEQTHTALYARLRALEDYLIRYYNRFKPDAVVSESPFSHLNIRTYGDLTKALYVARRAIYEYDETVRFYKIAPQEGKKAVGAKDYKDKNSTRCAILKLIEQGEITNHTVDIEALGHDAVDAISVGYAHCHRVATIVSLCRGFPLVGRY